MSTLKLKSKYCKLNPKSRLYHYKLPIIGLTGGIATGKSSVCAIFKERGLPIIDADKLIKSIYKKDSTVKLIKKIAPQALVNDTTSTSIDFKMLRSLFFSDSKIKKSLEEHLYQELEPTFLNEADALAAKNQHQFLIYDVPLLFEKRLQKKIDATVLVYADASLQLERLMKRDHIDRILAQKILDHQMPIDKKRELSDFIIENSQNMNELKNNTNALIQKLFNA